MESIINYYYGIVPEKMEKKDNDYLVYSSNSLFLFSEIINNEVEFEQIINLLNTTDIPYHLVVMTKENKPYVLYDEKKYCLLKVRFDNTKKISIFSFNNYSFKGDSNWADVWSKRVDYYESQVMDYVKDISVKYALQYYIGLAEIGISYANNLIDMFSKEDIKYTLSHKRISLPIKGIDYYNPLNIIVDIEVRDIAEYIKYAYFEDILTEYEILNMIDKIKFNEVLGNYFFLRLLYPSYFFYEYDEYVEKGEVNNKIFDYMKKSKDYEALLSKIYSRLRTYIDIKINLWFLKSQHL